jgi:enamine deaminase RidA (YjgF/YER057c/UK114 family)
MSHIQEIDVGWAWARGTPLVPAVKVGNVVYLSGQVALDHSGTVVGEGNLRVQTRKCFENIQDVLARVGGHLTDVVRLTTYFTIDITDAAARKIYWDVRNEFFGVHKPASTGIQVEMLIYPTLLLEIEAIAVLPDARQS